MPNHAQQTKLTRDHMPDRVPATSSAELQLEKSLRWNPISSTIWCWRGSVSHWMLPMLFASAGADWTQRGDIGQRAQDQEGCAHGLSDQREL